MDVSIFYFTVLLQRLLGMQPRRGSLCVQFSLGSKEGIAGGQGPGSECSISLGLFSQRQFLQVSNKQKLQLDGFFEIPGFNLKDMFPFRNNNPLLGQLISSKIDRSLASLTVQLGNGVGEKGDKLSPHWRAIAEFNDIFTVPNIISCS